MLIGGVYARIEGELGFRKSYKPFYFPVVYARLLPYGLIIPSFKTTPTLRF